MKQRNKILEAINRGIQLALDDYEDGPEELTPVRKNIINNPFTYVNWVVKLINKIELDNTIHVDPVVKRIHVDPVVKRTIRKFYKILINFYNLYNVKYKVRDEDELKELVKHIMVIDPKADLNWIDVSEITNMNCLFDDFCGRNFCGDVSLWDVSNVTTMSYMFYNCEKFNCDIGRWDVSNVTKMNYMFTGCKKFNLDLSKWNVSKVLDMRCMFSTCKEFNLDISGWDVSNVKVMSWMFSNAEKFNQDLSRWNVSNVERHSGFYYNSKFSYTPEYVPHFDINKITGNIIYNETF